MICCPSCDSDRVQSTPYAVSKWRCLKCGLDEMTWATFLEYERLLQLIVELVVWFLGVWFFTHL